MTGDSPSFTGGVKLNAIDDELREVITGMAGWLGSLPAIIFVAVESGPAPTMLIATTSKK